MRMLAVIALATAIVSPAMAQQARYKEDPKHCNANNAVDPYCRASQWRGSRYSGPRGLTHSIIGGDRVETYRRTRLLGQGSLTHPIQLGTCIKTENMSGLIPIPSYAMNYGEIKMLARNE